MLETNTLIEAIVQILKATLYGEEEDSAFIAGSIWVLRSVAKRLTLSAKESETLHAGVWNIIIEYHKNASIPKNADTIQVLEFLRDDLSTMAYNAKVKEASFK